MGDSTFLLQSSNRILEKDGRVGRRASQDASNVHLLPIEGPGRANNYSSSLEIPLLRAHVVSLSFSSLALLDSSYSCTLKSLPLTHQTLHPNATKSGHSINATVTSEFDSTLYPALGTVS